MNKKLTSLQIIKIIKDKTISKQSFEHKRQVMVFAFGEPFLKEMGMGFCELAASDKLFKINK